MAISYVGGTTGGARGNAVTTLVVSYASASGDTLVLSVVSEQGIVSVVDSNSATWTLLGGGSSLALAYIVGSAPITSVTITAGNGAGGSGGAISAALGEYAGISTINNSATNGFSSSPYTITKPLSSGGSATCTASYGVSGEGDALGIDFIAVSGADSLVAGGGTVTGSTPSFSATSGNLRQTGPSEISLISVISTAILMDNAVTYCTVTTQSPTNIGTTTSTGNGDITATGGANASAQGFMYSTSSFATPSNGTAPSGSFVSNSGSFGTGPFTASITGLSPNTTYFISAFAENSTGYSWGNVESFTTAANYATVTTQTPTSIATTTATGNGNITSLNSSGNATAEGFMWSTSSFSAPADGTAPSGSFVSNSGSFGTGTYTASITSLTLGTTYFVAAFVENAAGYSWGSVQAFTTVGYPSVTTQAASSITTTTATLNGNITSLGGAANCTARGFVYGTSNAGVPANGTAPGSSGWASNTSASGTFSTGTFNAGITGLTAFDEYFFLAFTENSAGFSYGTVVQSFSAGVPNVAGGGLATGTGLGF